MTQKVRPVRFPLGLPRATPPRNASAYAQYRRSAPAPQKAASHGAVETQETAGAVAVQKDSGTSMRQKA